MIEETGCQPLDAALVQQAWSNLQQLPAPWNTDAHSSLSSTGPASVGVVEFGELDGGEEGADAIYAVESIAAPNDGEEIDDGPPASIPIERGRIQLAQSERESLDDFAAASDGSPGRRA
jgi:hypothetical protein